MFGKIIGTGSYVPERVISNHDLMHFMDTEDEWIKDRTGIERRHVLENETTADMAAKAADNAIKAAGVDASEIDMIIVSSVSSNVILPNTACFVQDKIGARNACCFDLNTACTGFLMAYNTVQSYIHAGIIRTALIIGAEGLSHLVDWTDRRTGILFGDGAGAAVIRTEQTAVFETVMHANGSLGSALTCENEFAYRFRKVDHCKLINSGKQDLCSSDTIKNVEKTDYPDSSNRFYIRMDGQAVFKFAVRQVPACIMELLEKLGMREEEIDCFLLHQANKRIIESIAKRIGISIEKVPMNVMEYGNTSSACIPILLDETVKAGKIKRGDKIIMSGFGAGLTWAATYLEF